MSAQAIGDHQHDGVQKTIAEELREDVRRAAGMHYALPLSEKPYDTPPPAGKRLFYINHYGCPSAYYLEREEYYNAPYKTLAHADSLGKLTDLGREVLKKVALLRSDALDRTNELTDAGKRYTRELAHQMLKRFPELFTDSSYIDGRSIVENHCILTISELIVELSRAHQPLVTAVTASNRYYSWMNPSDPQLEALRNDSLTMVRYRDFTNRWAPDDKQLLAKLFNDADYASTVNAAALSRQLFDLAGSTQYMETVSGTSLFDLFSPEDIHRHWMRRNALAYIRYGGCTLNGGHQPYVQRKPLWNLIHMCDSVMQLDHPVGHIRYTNENMVMSLVCLLELDGYGVQTADLDSIETLGWADYRIAPYGGSIMMVHYRSDKNDPDPLVRVLLNGREARLPIKTDCAPYYHWNEVKRYYLRKLYAYARERSEHE